MMSMFRFLASKLGELIPISNEILEITQFYIRLYPLLVIKQMTLKNSDIFRGEVMDLGGHKKGFLLKEGLAQVFVS